jgi:hypothetical protein
MKTFSQFITEAEQRLKFKKYVHGSDKESIASIKKIGPKPSSQGSEGPGHYATPDSKKAQKYAAFVSKQRNSTPATVSYRVPAGRVSTTTDIPRGVTSKNKTTSEKPVVHNKKTGHVAMDSEYANKTMIRNPSPTIKKTKTK